MLKPVEVETIMTAFALVTGCAASRAATPTPLVKSSTIASVQLPGDGNGSKEIMEVFIQNPVNCGGTIITRTVEGWIQMNPIEEGGSRAQQITVYRVNYTFSNAAGDEYVVRETGIDQLYVEDNGDIVVLIAGKTPQHSGVIRFNTTTGEQTFEAGQFYDPPRNRACEALT